MATISIGMIMIPIFRKTTLYQIRAYRAFGAPTLEVAEKLRHARHQMIDPQKSSDQQFDDFIRSIQSRQTPERRQKVLEIYAKSSKDKRGRYARRWLGLPLNPPAPTYEYHKAQNEKYLWHTTRDIHLTADLTLKAGSQVFYAAKDLFTVNEVGTEFISRYVKRTRKC